MHQCGDTLERRLLCSLGSVDIIRGRRQADGTWLQQLRLPGRVWFDIDLPPGEPSKWLTFFATRAPRCQTAMVRGTPGR